jgi:Conjugative transposon protein TcpC
MVRRPNSGNGTQSPVYYLASANLAAGMQADGSLAARPMIGGSRGAGGRWLLWPLRAVLWTALLVIVFRGVTAIIFSSSPAPAGGTRTGTSGEFPVSLAEAYATEFGRVYLGFSSQSLAQREQALAAFVPASLSAANPSLGWNGIGQLNLQSVQAAGIKVQDQRHAVVTLLALLGGQLMELGVPVAATGSGLVVSGEPAWLPAPPQASPPSAPRVSDPVAQRQLMNELPAFFQAYASGDSAALNRFLVRGVSVAGLGGAVAFDQISALHVPPGGTARQITVTVIWQLPEPPGSVTAGIQGVTSKLEMSYGMSVVDLQDGKWYVKGIGASSETVGTR